MSVETKTPNGENLMNTINLDANTIKVARTLAAKLEELFSVEVDICTGVKADYVTVEGVNYSSFVQVLFPHNKAANYLLTFKTRKEQCDWLRSKIAERV